MTALQPTILTIFGITGDLAHRKLLPALYYLAHENLLPESFKIVGITRRGTTVEEVMKVIRDNVLSSGEECHEPTLKLLTDSLSIVTMDMDDSKQYAGLKKYLDNIEDEAGKCMGRLFYLAIPSATFVSVVEQLGGQGLNTGCQHGSLDSRLLIEKPFGYDLESAETLIDKLSETFSEDQVYRIDHYLAKETVQNILTFRFENPLFNGSWDKNHISHIMITASESIGIEGRTVFYEQMGALRDLIQSHLLQLLALVTMERPTEMSAEAIHKSKAKLLGQIRPPKNEDLSTQTVRGQYANYKQEVDNPSSQIETYGALKLTIENDRWQGVPLFIRTGKSLSQKVTEITIVFSSHTEPSKSNYLTIRIQPNEGIVLDLSIKKPGFETTIERVQMDFCYNQELNATHPGAYERVLVDAMRGDKTLFATSEEVLASWRITEPVLEAWQAGKSPLHIYEVGSDGPAAADKSIEDAGVKWPVNNLHICAVHQKTES